MKSKVRLLAIFLGGLITGALAVFFALGRINQKQFADHYALGVIEQTSLGTEIRAGRQDAVAQRIEANLPSYVLAIHENNWLRSDLSTTALHSVKNFYEINSLPVPENISGILNDLPSE